MKKFLFLALAFAMILSLAACSKKEKVKPDDPAPQSGGDVQTVESDVTQPLDPYMEPSDTLADPDYGGNAADEDSLFSKETDPAESINPADVLDELAAGGSSAPPSEEVPDEEELADGEDQDMLQSFKLDKSLGERPICDEYLDNSFGIDGVYVREKLLVDGAQVSDAIVTSTVVFLNEYSREGFLRELENGKAVDDNMRHAAVLVCKLINIPYEKVWQNGYSDEKVVNLIVETLDAAALAGKDPF